MTPYEYQSGAQMKASYAAIRKRLGLTGNVPHIKTRERGSRLYDAPIGPECPIEWEALMQRRIAIMSLDERPTPTIREIKETVARAYGITVIAMESCRRRREEVDARFVFYWLARNYTRKSLADIGRAVGGKDHTTVRHGVEMVNRNRNRFDPWISKAMSAMRLA